jgi:hypothetical protein
MLIIFKLFYITFNPKNNSQRDVVASELLLNVPERIDWRECVKTQEEEKEMSVEFRNNFKKFDPFL